MHFTRTLAALVVGASLAACGQQTATPTQTPAPVPASTSAPAATQAADQGAKPAGSVAAAAAPAATGQVTAAALVGRWGDNGDCTKDIVISADGTFRSYTGGSGAWSLNGDILTMSGANGTGQVRVEGLSATQLLIENADGSIGTSQRC